MITYFLNEAKRNIGEILANIDRALVQKDYAVLERLMADDFVGAIPTGDSLSKKSFIAHHCMRGSGIIAMSEAAPGAGNIRFYSRAAIINRRVQERVKLPTGEVFKQELQRLDVLVKNEKGWLLAGEQDTVITSPVAALSSVA